MKNWLLIVTLLSFLFSCSPGLNPTNYETVDGSKITQDMNIKLPTIVGGLQYLYKQAYYPEDARRNKLQGKVVARFLVKVNGRASNIEILETPKSGFGFEDSAINALKNVRFNTAKKDGKPVNFIHTMPIYYKLDIGTQ